MRILSGFLTALMIVSSVVAQEYSYGQPSDLKGLKKVFVDTGPDFKSRESILKDLEKSKLDLEIVDDLEGAEIVLAFGAGKTVMKALSVPMGNGVLTSAKSQKTGAGFVLASARGKMRIVHSFEDVQQSGWERKPVTNFTREFVKIYKKANEIK